MVASIITTEHSMSRPIDAGQVVTPRSVCGVTTAPRTGQPRATGGGTLTGRPGTAAAATATTEPETRPAGRPRNVNVSAPASAIANVSAVSFSIRGGGST